MTTHHLILFVFSSAFLIGCLSDKKIREPRSVYMADMYKSRSYQAQTNDSFFNTKVGNKRPKGVMSVNAIVPYDLPNDEKSYLLSAKVKNPLLKNDALFSKGKVLYNINCAICHGDKLDGNGYLYRSGDGPYLAKPATLIGDLQYEEMQEGTMFHSIYYGKNLMGSYASQLTQKQIWSVVHYIKSKQQENQKK